MQNLHLFAGISCPSLSLFLKDKGKKVGLAVTFFLLVLVQPGCAIFKRNHLEKNLLSAQNNMLSSPGVQEYYRVSCPDELRLVVPQRPELTGNYPIGPEGRINLGTIGQLRVEGHTLPEIVRAIAEKIDSPPENVKVEVARYNSQFVILIGQVIGWQRVVPYRGQETVLDLFQRIGGSTPGTTPEDVYVVRPHFEDGQHPEVYHVDLHAVVLRHDERTNIRLQPFDQVYVGETQQHRLEKIIPPWFMPFYQKFWHPRSGKVQK